MYCLAHLSLAPGGNFAVWFVIGVWQINVIKATLNRDVLRATRFPVYFALGATDVGAKTMLTAMYDTYRVYTRFEYSTASSTRNLKCVYYF